MSSPKHGNAGGSFSGARTPTDPSNQLLPSTLPTWHDTAQSALASRANGSSSSSSCSSSSSSSPRAPQYPPPSSPPSPYSRRNNSGSSTANSKLRTSVYENLGLPTDADGDFASVGANAQLPEWSPALAVSGPLMDDKSARSFMDPGYTSTSASDEKRRQSVAFSMSSSRTGKDPEKAKQLGGTKRQSMHSVHQSLQNEMEEVQEVFDEEPSTGNTMKWKWSRPDGSSRVDPARGRRRVLCAVFLFIAATSAASIGVSGTLMKRSMTAYWFDNISEDERVTQDMLEMSPDMLFALVVSTVSFFVALAFAATYLLPPARIEDKVARAMAGVLSFPRRAVGGLLFLVLLIGAWSAVTSLTTMTHATCTDLRKLNLQDDMMVMVGLGRQMSVFDCRINDSLLGFSVIGLVEWLIAFAVVVDGHARRLIE